MPLADGPTRGSIVNVAEDARLTSAVPSVWRQVCSKRPPTQRRKVASPNWRFEGGVPSLIQRTVNSRPPCRSVEAIGDEKATSATTRRAKAATVQCQIGMDSGRPAALVRPDPLVANRSHAPSAQVIGERMMTTG